MPLLLQQLRQLMRDNLIDFYWVPGTDRHFNEYVPCCWQRRTFVSGFDGSNGDLLVGLDGAWLWTDSRYFIQAEKQLSSDIQLMRLGIDQDVFALMAEQVTPFVIGFDPQLISIQQREKWQRFFQHGIGSMRMIDGNLVDPLWKEQPPVPESPVVEWSQQYAGMLTEKKLASVRAELQKRGSDATLLTRLDSIAWLTNCRGQDLETSPVFISFLLLTQDNASLYLRSDRFNGHARHLLNNAGIYIKDESQLAGDLAAVQGNISLDPQTTSAWVLDQIEADVSLLPCMIPMMKAVKNSVEQQGMRQAHQLDAVAIIKLMYWLESHWEGLDEVDITDQLEKFRREEPLYQGPSFPTISAFSDHSAIAHYSPQRVTAKKLSNDNFLLLDMGGQYLSGTTDATRMFYFGSPSKDQVKFYTLVLKGHLAIRHAIFPHGTCGEHLDAMARMPLWKEFAHYGHGTGHGVGCYLDVHEGPHRIAPTYTGVPLLPGMVVSNEPGFYAAGEYGIRIENLLLVKKIATVENSPTGHGPFYAFEDLTLLPYNQSLIDTNMLTLEEVQKINSYHQYVQKTLTPLLSAELCVWLDQATKPLK